MSTGGRMALETVRDFSDLRVLVIGDAMLDAFVDGTASRICREAPVPVVDKRSQEWRPGGAANTAANLRALGADTLLVALTGNDHAGIELRAALTAAGVEDAGLVRDDAASTLQKSRIIADDQLMLRLDEGSLAHASMIARQSLLAAVERYLPRCDLVVISDYGHDTVTDEIITRISQLRADYPCPLVVDAKEILRYADSDVTLFTPNLDEARAAAGDHTGDAEAVGGRLRDRIGSGHIAITLAGGGALLVDEEGACTALPTRPIRKADDVGAGDSFTAAAALALATSGDPLHAVRIGIDAASLRCASHDRAIVTQRDLLRRVGLDQDRTSKRHLSREELASQLAAERLAGKRIVFTNGVFDIMHAGHVQLLRQAKALGDILVVGVNSDASVRRLKGPRRPVNHERDRIALVAALDAVDHAIIFREDTPADVIRALRPDIHVKGGDYTADSLPEIDAVREVGTDVRILPLRGELSTTNVIHRIVSLNGRDRRERAV